MTSCIYLQDSSVTLYGIKVYGTPWQPWFGGWAFNLERGETILEKWNLIPNDADIVMSHGPPLGLIKFIEKNGFINSHFDIS